MAKHDPYADSSSLAAKAAKKAQKKLKGAQHAKRAQSVRRLDAVRIRLGDAFRVRAAARTRKAEDDGQAGIEEALDLLDAQRKLHESFKAMKRPDAEEVSGVWVEVAEGGVEMQRTAASQGKAIAAAENAYEEKLYRWLDGVLAKAIESLWDDKARTAAIASLSGGLILVGLVPQAAIAAAAASLALLARDLATRAEQEEAILDRTEKGLVLVRGVTDLGERWVTILSRAR